MKEIDAAIARYLASEADRLRRREEERTALLLWGADMPGGPFPDAFKIDPNAPRPPVRPAAGHPPDTGKGSRHLRRKAAAKARH